MNNYAKFYKISDLAYVFCIAITLIFIKMNENEEMMTPEQTEATVAQEREPVFREASSPVEEPAAEPAKCEKKKCNCKWCSIIAFVVLFAAVIALYIMHFCCGGKAETFTPTPVVAEPGDGSVLFINLDSVNANYFFIEEKQKEFDEEMRKQDEIFKQKQANFQKRYEQFQKNYQAGILTDVQIQNAQAQLQAEYQKLEDDYNAVVNALTDKQVAVNREMLDSVQAVSARIVAKRNASFVMTYQKDLPLLLYADPTREITEEVLFELNKSKKEE